MALNGVGSLADRYVSLVLATLGTREDDRLHGIRECVETVLDHGIPGDALIAGSRLGASAVFVRALLAANRAIGRWVWLASPEGSWRDLDGVHGALTASELLDDTVRFVEGPMWHAVPVAPIEQLALLHLDAGTGDAVEHLLLNLYPRLAVGGFAIVDEVETDPGCRAAVDRFRNARGIASHMRQLGGGAVVWRKEHA